MNNMEPRNKEEMEEVKKDFSTAGNVLADSMLIKEWADVEPREVPFSIDPSLETGREPLIIILPPTNEDGEWDDFTLDEISAALNGAIMGVLQVIAPGSKVMNGVQLWSIDW